jgi:hypothetical protein
MSPRDAAETEATLCQLCPTRLAQSATQLLGTGLNDIVPPEAQRHLLNAQRELLLAALLTIEHNTSRASRTAPARGRKRRSTARSRRPSHVELESGRPSHVDLE